MDNLPANVHMELWSGCEMMLTKYVPLSYKLCYSIDIRYVLHFVPYY